ncbi:hypothetical protein OG247_40595 [Streptomyces sp. NBC_01244]|nr:hypothetical protein OG247_40595 [Streptomyces sp. NBC_01244]
MRGSAVLPPAEPTTTGYQPESTFSKSSAKAYLAVVALTLGGDTTFERRVAMGVRGA